MEAMRAAMASRLASIWPGVLSHEGVLFLKEEVSSNPPDVSFNPLKEPELSPRPSCKVSGRPSTEPRTDGCPGVELEEERLLPWLSSSSDQARVCLKDCPDLGRPGSGLLSSLSLAAPRDPLRTSAPG